MRRRLFGWPYGPAVWLVLAVSLFIAACGKRSASPVAPAAVTPGDATPSETLRRLEWSMNHNDLDVYLTLFTEDFVFVFSALDPYGDAYRGDLWTRADEMISADHLFRTGTVSYPPASHLSVMFDKNLRVSADPRPGKDPRWHKVIRTTVVMTVVTPQQQIFITGFAGFNFVRGDSAQVPPEVVAIGFAPDSTHWFIDRWEDDTAGSGGGIAHAMPTTNFTLGALKVLYREDAPAVPGARMPANSSRQTPASSRGRPLPPVL
jgi:hypothetical protein